MGGFRYAPALLERFPTTRAGVVHAAGVVNGATGEELADAYRDQQERSLVEIGDAPLSALLSLAAWRRVFREFGVDPTQYRSAVEALLRRLTKQGEIPSISALVDLANLVSIRHRLPVAVFDQRTVTGATTVREAAGSESFTDLGSGQQTSPERGEVVFVDDADLVSARRWCWRQSAESAAGLETTEVVITVEGHHEGAEDDVARAVEDISTLLGRHQPGAAMEAALLGPDRDRFDF